MQLRHGTFLLSRIHAMRMAPIGITYSTFIAISVRGFFHVPRADWPCPLAGLNASRQRSEPVCGHAPRLVGIVIGEQRPAC